MVTYWWLVSPPHHAKSSNHLHRSVSNTHVAKSALPTNSAFRIKTATYHSNSRGLASLFAERKLQKRSGIWTASVTTCTVQFCEPCRKAKTHKSPITTLKTIKTIARMIHVIRYSSNVVHSQARTSREPPFQSAQTNPVQDHVQACLNKFQATSAEMVRKCLATQKATKRHFKTICYPFARSRTIV